MENPSLCSSLVKAKDYVKAPESLHWTRRTRRGVYPCVCTCVCQHNYGGTESSFCSCLFLFKNQPYTFLPLSRCSWALRMGSNFGNLTGVVTLTPPLGFCSEQASFSSGPDICFLVFFVCFSFQRHEFHLISSRFQRESTVGKLDIFRDTTFTEKLATRQVVQLSYALVDRVPVQLFLGGSVSKPIQRLQNNLLIIKVT